MLEPTRNTFDLFVGTSSEFIRAAGEVVGFIELLDHLEATLGDHFLAVFGPDALPSLIELLWEQPHIYQPDLGWIEFVWDEGRSERERTERLFPSLKDALRGQVETPSEATHESSSMSVLSAADKRSEPAASLASADEVSPHDK
jgi:hypothetical protein